MAIGDYWDPQHIKDFKEVHGHAPSGMDVYAARIGEGWQKKLGHPLTHSDWVRMHYELGLPGGGAEFSPPRQSEMAKIPSLLEASPFEDKWGQFDAWDRARGGMESPEEKTRLNWSMRIMGLAGSAGQYEQFRQAQAAMAAVATGKGDGGGGAWQGADVDIPPDAPIEAPYPGIAPYQELATYSPTYPYTSTQDIRGGEDYARAQFPGVAPSRGLGGYEPGAPSPQYFGGEGWGQGETRPPPYTGEGGIEVPLEGGGILVVPPEIINGTPQQQDAWAAQQGIEKVPGTDTWRRVGRGTPTSTPTPTPWRPAAPQAPSAPIQPMRPSAPQDWGSWWNQRFGR